MATLQAEAGRAQDAVTTVLRGVELNPYSPRFNRLLAALNISVQAYDNAIETMKKGLELFPEDSFMRSLKEQTGNAQRQGGSSSSKKPS